MSKSGHGLEVDEAENGGIFRHVCLIRPLARRLLYLSLVGNQPIQLETSEHGEPRVALPEPEVAAIADAVGRGSDGIELPAEWTGADPIVCTPHDAFELRTRERHVDLHSLSPAQLVKAALRGNRRARAQIFAGRDTLLLRLVAHNPGLTDEEALSVARSGTTSSEALRQLATSPAWSQIHAIRVALVENPRTPVAEALRLLSGLRNHDLRLLARNRNVPVVVATHARRALERREGRLTQTARLVRSVSSHGPGPARGSA